jgi:hypothetical protein
MFIIWGLINMIFWFFLHLLGTCLLLYTSCVYEALYAFNDILITYQKRKKKKDENTF